MEARQFKKVHQLVKEGVECILDDFGVETGTPLSTQLLSSVEEVFEEPKFYGIDIAPSSFSLPQSLESKGPVGVDELIQKLKWEINFFHSPANWFGLNHYMIGMRVKAKRDFRVLTFTEHAVEYQNYTVCFEDLMEMHNIQKLFYSRPVESLIVQHWCDRKRSLRLEEAQLATIESLM